jgi:hypothetical protein
MWINLVNRHYRNATDESPGDLTSFQIVEVLEKYIKVRKHKLESLDIPTSDS